MNKILDKVKATMQMQIVNPLLSPPPPPPSWREGHKRGFTVFKVQTYLFKL